MRIVHTVAGLAPHNGGPAYSVPRLRRALDTGECSASVFTVRETDTPAPCEASIKAFSSVLPHTPFIGPLRWSPELTHALDRVLPEIDILHVHGLWLIPNVSSGWAAARARVPLVISPRGMLSPGALRFSTLKKRVFWAMLQGPAYKHAALWHATSAQEAEDIQAFGVRKPIAVIRNGVDLPNDVAKHEESRSRRTLLFLSRVHPKKGLPQLIEAWTRISPNRPNWDLVIAGPDEIGHRLELEKQIARSGTSNIRFVGPVYGEARNELMMSADLFTLPTHSENFGIAVAEALAAGIPAIVTKGAPWEGLQAYGCGWWIDHGVEPLTQTLHEATARSPADRRGMGVRGRSWMTRDFGWDEIAARMARAYDWVLERGDQPAFVTI